MNEAQTGNQHIPTVEYLLPKGFPSTQQRTYHEAADLGGQLTRKGVTRDFVEIQNTELWVRMNVFTDGASFEVQKHAHKILIYFFNYRKNKDQIYNVVKDFYKRYKLGKPEHPKNPLWIHFVPTRIALLDDNERTLLDTLAFSFYWAIHRQLKDDGKI